MSDKLTRFVIKFRWPIVLLFPLIAGVMLSQAIPHFDFAGSVRIWFGKEDPIIKDYDRFKANFGTDETVVIAFRDEEGIFRPKPLATIDRITEKLWQTQYIGRVDSITNYQYVHADAEFPDDIIVDDFIDDIDSLTPEELQKKKEIATTEIQTLDRLISKDGTTAVIMARMIPRVQEGNEEYFILREAVEKILAEETAQTGYEFRSTGVPFITTEFINIAKADTGKFTPMVFLAAFVLLVLLFRRVSGGAAPFLVVFITVAIIISFLTLLGFKFNNFTANLPVFIVAIGVADAVHIYWVWLLSRRGGKDNHEAIRLSLEKNLRPALLTSITTFIGFISLVPSEVIPVKTLGLSTAGAAIIAFILSAVFLPALLAILRPKVKPHTEDVIDEYHIPPFAEKYSRFVLNNEKTILGISLTILVACAIGLAFVKVDSQGIRYFKPDTEIRQTVAFIEEHVTGPLNLEIIVDSGESSGVKSPEFLHKVEEFSEALKQQFPERIRHVHSLLDVVKRFNRVMHAEDPAYYAIPDNKNLIAQYLFLYSLSLPQGMEINDQMDVDERLFRITAANNAVSSSKNMEIITWTEEWWKKTPYDVSISGQNAMYTYMQENVTETLIVSISLALTLVVLTMLVAFRSVSVMLISILTTVMPVILVVGVMGWLGIDIGLGVAISAAIIMGVAVDDTIHFLVKYRYARSRGKEIKEALEYMISYSGAAIIMTTIVLSLAFSLMLMSSFAPNFNFAIVTATALVLALLIDLLMLPALLSVMEKRKL